MAPPEVRLYINDDNDNYTFSQELRFASELDADDRFAWLAGMYYEDGEEDVAVGDFLLPGGGVLVGNANHNGRPADFFFKEDFVTQLKQLAVFRRIHPLLLGSIQRHDRIPALDIRKLL